jgi:hypothetical protein
MRERPQALLPYYSNKKEKLPVLKAAAIRENLFIDKFRAA